jgi:hypothetical protein
MTGLSTTLKSWYVLFLSSIVVLGTSCDLFLYLNAEESEDSSFGVALGVGSTVLSAVFILVHYNFFPRIEAGGWLELSSSFFLILLWILGLSILTSAEGIAATVTGSQCGASRREFVTAPNCTIVVFYTEGDGQVVQETIPCETLPRQVPGSNLYFAIWACFLSSLNITFRWKAAQALQLAQAKTEIQKQNGIENENDGSDNNDSSVGDLDEDAI